MKLKKSNDGSELTVTLAGEVDAANVTEIEEKLLKEAAGVTDLTFDLKELEYISSAGLRVLLQMQKMMKTQGNMVISNTNDEVMDIFKVTGFVRLLNIV
ncbi:MAG: STAS domain-containing protein [Ruminiclostridium sp.]|nr:STAS domain-containing protein [Ruminiclostridium sp.]